MWTYVDLVRMESSFGKWRAMVRLSDDGVQSAYFLKFQSEPTEQQAQALAAQLVVRRNALDADAEFETALDATTFVLKYQTAGQFRNRVREAYRNATGARAAKIAYWLVERVLDGTFTDNQIQSAFGLTQNQYNTLKAKFIALHNQYAAVNEAQGE